MLLPPVMEPMTTALSQYVGFDSITKQIESKLLKRGFQFNVSVRGGKQREGNVSCSDIGVNIFLPPLR